MAPRGRGYTEMNATAWTVLGATIPVLVAICASLRGLRADLREQSAQIGLLRERLARLEGLRAAVAGTRVA